MKAILMSIKPQYVAKILNGEKTIEVRKRFPKDYRGWVYIYCTKELPLYIRRDMSKEAELYGIDMTKKCYIATVGKVKHNSNYPYDLSGKVVARFYCDNVEEIKYQKEETEDSKLFNKLTCLSNEELDNYLHKKNGYAIHISQLEIFDKPKELSEFYSSYRCKRHEHIFGNNNIEIDKKYGGLRQPTRRGYEYVYPLTKAPQSWQFIEVAIY